MEDKPLSVWCRGEPAKNVPRAACGATDHKNQKGPWIPDGFLVAFGSLRQMDIPGFPS
jgi:hypothetical protein